MIYMYVDFGRYLFCLGFVEVESVHLCLFKKPTLGKIWPLFTWIFFNVVSSIIQELQLHPCLKISLTPFRLFISSNHFLCSELDYYIDLSLSPLIFLFFKFLLLSSSSKLLNIKYFIFKSRISIWFFLASVSLVIFYIFLFIEYIFSFISLYDFSACFKILICWFQLLSFHMVSLNVFSLWEWLSIFLYFVCQRALDFIIIVNGTWYRLWFMLFI